MHTLNATKCISHGSAKKANKYHNNSNNSNNELIIVNFTACAFFKSAASVHCIKRLPVINVFSSYVNDQSCLTYAGKQSHGATTTTKKAPKEHFTLKTKSSSLFLCTYTVNSVFDHRRQIATARKNILEHESDTR